MTKLLITRQPCLYIFCAETTTVSSTESLSGGTETLVRTHTIVHPILSGTCIMSLMHLPLSLAARLLVEAREHEDSIIIQHAVREGHSESRGMAGDSTTLRGIRRRGREPEPDSADWQLNGRADEDIKPDAKRHRNPIGILGQEMGHRVATVNELIADINEAALKSGEALGGLQEMQNTLSDVLTSIGQARDIIYRVTDNETQGALVEYASLLSKAHLEAASLSARLEEAKGMISAGQEKGQEYIGRLLS